VGPQRTHERTQAHQGLVHAHKGRDLLGARPRARRLERCLVPLARRGRKLRRDLVLVLVQTKNKIIINCYNFICSVLQGGVQRVLFHERRLPVPGRGPRRQRVFGRGEEPHPPKPGKVPAPDHLKVQDWRGRLFPAAHALRQAQAPQHREGRQGLPLVRSPAGPVQDPYALRMFLFFFVCLFVFEYNKKLQQTKEGKANFITQGGLDIVDDDDDDDSPPAPKRGRRASQAKGHHHQQHQPKSEEDDDDDNNAEDDEEEDEHAKESNEDDEDDPSDADFRTSTSFRSSKGASGSGVSSSSASSSAAKRRRTRSSNAGYIVAANLLYLILFFVVSPRSRPLLPPKKAH